MACTVTQTDILEACYRTENNPLQSPLPEKEIARLKEIYETSEW